MKTKMVQRRNAKKKAAANSNQNSDPLYANDVSADYIGMSPAFLDKDRWRGATIPFIRIGSGKGVIRYRQSVLDAYLKNRTEGPKQEERK